MFWGDEASIWSISGTKVAPNVTTSAPICSPPENRPTVPPERQSGSNDSGRRIWIPGLDPAGSCRKPPFEGLSGDSRGKPGRYLDLMNCPFADHGDPAVPGPYVNALNRKGESGADALPVRLLARPALKRG